MMSILDLNDDCLIRIFDFFSIYELIELEKVCRVFKSTCKNVYGTRRFHKMTIELRTLQTDYFGDIFDAVGDTLRNFEFSGGHIMNENVKRTMINGVSTSCPRLKSLTINHTPFTSTNFIQLQKCFENLIYLDLSRCGINEDRLGMTLDGEMFNQIRTLKLSGNSSMNGSFFKNMIHVEVLDVSYCYELKIDELLIFIKSCIKLIDLDISASGQVEYGVNNFLNVLHAYQPHIETLLMEKNGILGNFYFKDILAKFVNLKVCRYEGCRFGT